MSEPRIPDSGNTDTPTLSRPHDALWRRAAEALMRHGDYSESKDAMEWLHYEAGDVADLVELGYGAESIAAILADDAWWDPSSETPDRAYAVAAELGVEVPR